jgi:uncharacterized protein (TIGR02246 family)
MPESTDESQIRALVADWAKAVRAKDMDGVIAHHAEDVVMFDVPMPLLSKGLEEYRGTWELFFANSPGGPGSFDVTEMSVFASDTVAYCHAILRIVDSEARLTLGMRKVNQQWLIAHEHHSYPLELEPEE